MKNSPFPLRLALAVGVAMFSTGLMAQAADWLVVSGKSWHFERRGEFRSSNPGIGWERPSAEWPLSWMAGFYRNSYDHETAYAGGRWEPLRWDHVRLGIFGGLANGYWTPVVALPMASLEYGRVGINIVAAPTVREYVGYVAVQVKFRLD